MTIPNDRLRGLRRRTGLKVGQFAELVGCSAAHLTNCENGNRTPSPELAERIAREARRLLEQPVTVADFKPGNTTPDRPHPQPNREPKAPPKRQDTEKRTAPKRNSAPDQLQAAS